jgi:hypothetical protein
LSDNPRPTNATSVEDKYMNLNPIYPQKAMRQRKKYILPEFACKTQHNQASASLCLVGRALLV